MNGLETQRQQKRAAQTEETRYAGATIGNSLVGKRNTVAMQIQAQLDQLNARVGALAERIENGLYAVSMPEGPENCTKTTDCIETIPPLFAEYRAHIAGISHSLSRIDSALDRLEI